MTTLELLPMWSGVDPDAEVFISGVVKDDDGDWGVGGQGLGQDEAVETKPEPEAGGSGSGSGSGSGAAAPADPVMVGGTRMFLSQIREWVVEYSADQLFLSVRTDAGWYRLCRWAGGGRARARASIALLACCAPPAACAV
jgi:DNA (cytosine-5)-methyltransferase 1